MSSFPYCEQRRSRILVLTEFDFFFIHDQLANMGPVGASLIQIQISILISMTITF